MSAPTRVSVWSGPRNVSTALMYAFAQRADTTVVDEPLYGHYLARVDRPHPGRDEVLAAMDTDGARVVREVLHGPVPTDVLMCKNMAHHLHGLDDAAGEVGWVLDGLVNVLLVRAPAAVVTSFAEQVHEPILQDTGLDQQVRVLDREVAAGRDPIVVDSADLLADPPAVLAALCARVGIAWDPAMLAWPAGPKPYDGVWAPHWYANVHRSTGFAAPRPADREVPARLRPLLAACQPLYERLRAHAVRRA